MIWAIVNSRFCFCWLHIVSPSLASENIISLIMVLTICWDPCVESSHGLLQKCLLWPACSLDKTLFAFALLHFVLQCQSYLLLQVSLDFLLFHSNPLWWKGHLFLVLVLEDLVGIHRTGQLHHLWHQWLGHRLGFLRCWMVCRGKEPRSFVSLWLFPSTAVQTLLLTVRATPFLLRDSCPQ